MMTSQRRKRRKPAIRITVMKNQNQHPENKPDCQIAQCPESAKKYITTPQKQKAVVLDQDGRHHHQRWCTRAELNPVLEGHPLSCQ